jgi:metallo-beta-lactamase family protein
MHKTKNKVRVKFIGNNSEDVTGSCVLIETETKKILVECGLYQGDESLLEQYKINSRKFNFKVKDIDYLILAHSHIDHVGLVPRLYKQGANCKIIAPIGLKNLFDVMAKDSAHIMNKDAEDLTKKFNRLYEPIYTAKDVELALSYWNEYEKNQVVEIDDEIKIRFTNSSHIINSCQCELWVKNKNRTVKIGVTSDLGNISINQYYVDEFQPIEKANLLIGEATYAKELKNLTNKHKKKDLEKIETVIRQVCIENRGKVLIPVFALQRCQVILTHLFDIFSKKEDFHIPIIVDSPLALKINKIFLEELKGEQREKFKEVLEWKNLKTIKEFEDTEEMATNKEPCVFLSCGGMLQAGRAVYTAGKLLPNPYNCIMFCGYSSEESLATKIKNKKQKTITIDGKSIPCRCQSVILNSFSSHMQREQLLKYYSEGNFDKIAIVHSNFDSKIKFCKELQEQISKKNKTNKVICVNKSTEILL